MNQIEKAMSDYLGEMCGMRLKPHALTGLAKAAIAAMQPAPPQKQEGTDMNQIEKVARAAAWLRECHDWLLSNDLDMGCPMVENPLDLAEELEAIAAMPVQAEPVAWMYERPPTAWLSPRPIFIKVRWPEEEREGWTETPLYAQPPAPQWQGIESAPRDGRKMLVGCWIKKGWLWWSIEAVGNVGLDGLYGEIPTHWADAPTPPAGGSDAE